MFQKAHRLASFVLWLEHEGRVPLAEVGESDIASYASAMERSSGAWSIDGKALARSTVRTRQVEAIHFLTWCRERGVAPGFKARSSVREIRVPSLSGAKATRKVRTFNIVRRPAPTTIRFPSNEQVRAHVHGIADPAVQLGAMLIYGMGLRATELTQVTLADALSPASRAGRQLMLSVLGKGDIWRRVELPANLHPRMVQFARFERAIRVRRLAEVDRPATFLVREDGQPLAYRGFWKAFKVGLPEFSPHLGRHWYAVNFLSEALAARRSAGLYVDPGDLRTTLFPELIRLKENLGHSSLEVTERYLVALSQQLTPVDVYQLFNDVIDGTAGGAAL
jgi:site-specific recombinase XerD